MTLGEREQDAIRAVLDGLEREVDVKLELGPTATPVTLLAAGGREIDSNALTQERVSSYVRRWSRRTCTSATAWRSMAAASL